LFPGPRTSYYTIYTAVYLALLLYIYIDALYYTNLPIDLLPVKLSPLQRGGKH